MQIKWWNSKLTSDLSHVIHIIKRWKQTASRPNNYRRKQLFPLNSGLNHRFLQFETNFKATFSGICYRTRPRQLISHPDYIGPIDLIHVCLSLSNTCFFIPCMQCLYMPWDTINMRWSSKLVLPQKRVCGQIGLLTMWVVVCPYGFTKAQWLVSFSKVCMHSNLRLSKIWLV